MDQSEPNISDRTPCRQGTKPNYVLHGIKLVVLSLRYQFKYSHDMLTEQILQKYFQGLTYKQTKPQQILKILITFLNTTLQ